MVLDSVARLGFKLALQNRRFLGPQHPWFWRGNCNQDYIYIYIWVNLITTSLWPSPGIMVNKRNHPKMALFQAATGQGEGSQWRWKALFQVSELLQCAHIYIYINQLENKQCAKHLTIIVRSYEYIYIYSYIYIHILIYWYIDILIYWYIDILIYWYIDIDILIYWCWYTDILIYWYIHRSIDWLTDCLIMSSPFPESFPLFDRLSLGLT